MKVNSKYMINWAAEVNMFRYEERREKINMAAVLIRCFFFFFSQMLLKHYKLTVRAAGRTLSFILSNAAVRYVELTMYTNKNPSMPAKTSA